jgi:hypothetical protein
MNTPVLNVTHEFRKMTQLAGRVQLTCENGPPHLPTIDLQRGV